VRLADENRLALGCDRSGERRSQLAHTRRAELQGRAGMNRTHLRPRDRRFPAHDVTLEEIAYDRGGSQAHEGVPIAVRLAGAG